MYVCVSYLGGYFLKSYLGGYFLKSFLNSFYFLFIILALDNPDLHLICFKFSVLLLVSFFFSFIIYVLMQF